MIDIYALYRYNWIHFLRLVWVVMQWLNDHPDFKLNPLFIGADSYSGLIAPIIAQEIMDGKPLHMELRAFHLIFWVKWFYGALVD